MKKSSNLLPIIIMFFLFSMISFVTGMQDPFGVIVRAQFKASNALSQLGNFANFIAYACMGLPAGMILKRFGYKISALLAVSVGFIGVCITFLSGVVESFGVYLTGAFVSGFSMCMLNSIVNPMLNTLGGGGKRGNQLVQFGGSCNSINATIVPVLIGYLIGTVSQDTKIADANPALFIAMGVFAFAFIVLLFSRIPEPELEMAKEAGHTEKVNMGDAIRGALQHKNLVFGMIAIFMYVGMEVGIANVTNLFLTSSEVGVTASISGTIVGMYWFLMFVGRFVGGIFGGKIQVRTMLTTVLVTGIALLIIGMCIGTRYSFTFSGEQIPLCVACFVLCGLCNSVMWGSVFNLAVNKLGEYTSIASGLFMIMVCGGGVLPILQAWSVNYLGFVGSYTIPMLALCYILWFALKGSRVKE